MPPQSSSDLQQEKQLRLSYFDSFRSQGHVVDDLKVFVEMARRRDETLDYVLLCSPPGLDKTTLSHTISRELGVGIKVTSGPVLEKTGDLARLLTSLKPRDILFTDEIHRLSHAVEEYLYSAMKDFRIDPMIDKGPRARSIQMDLNPSTLVGTTTRSGLLTALLRNRFGINLHLEYYNVDMLTDIVLHSTRIPEVPCEEGAARGITLRSRDTPHIVNALLRRVRDFTQVKGNKVIDSNITTMALGALHINKNRLDHMGHKLLKTIIDKFDGGLVGLSTIAAAMGKDPGTIKEVYKPFLVQEGFVQRTHTGRQATRLAYACSGRTYRRGLPPEVSLFD